MPPRDPLSHVVTRRVARLPRSFPRFLAGALVLPFALAPIACRPPDAEAPKAPEAKPPVVVRDDSGEKQPLPAVPAEETPTPRKRIEIDDATRLRDKTASYFDAHATQRMYLQVDKPLYKPGETIWLRTWDLRARDFTGVVDGVSAYELVTPKGAVAERKLVQTSAGYSTNDFVLPDGAQGGEYTLRVTAPDGVQQTRPVIVSTYEAPRVKKKLEFMRKAYGPGDVVSATLELKRPTGEPLANLPVSVVARLDGVELPRESATTDAAGATVVKVQLPASIALGDGLLTVLVDDGGVTESISRAIPIVLKQMQMSFFPEGGKLVTGLQSRVYFEAKTPLGKPADVEGRVVDDQGNVAATFASYKQGLGRFTLRPARGRTYTVQLSKPEGLVDKFDLPVAVDDGCVLRSYDDLDGQREELRVGVTCTSARKVIVAEAMRDTLVDAAGLEVDAGETSVLALAGKDVRAMGVARVTLMDDKLQPLAERVVYRNRRERLDVKVTPHKKSYAPRDQVTLSIATTDGRGAPIPAELALSVVDDTVLSFADDKVGHLLSRLTLEPELPGDIDEPNFYFDLTEDKSALALELLMGTRGWRTFEWQTVLNPPPPAMPMPTAGTAAIAAAVVEEDAMAMRGGAAPVEAVKQMAMPAAVERRDMAMKAKGAAEAPADKPMRLANAVAPAAPPPPPMQMPMPAVMPPEREAGVVGRIAAGRAAFAERKAARIRAADDGDGGVDRDFAAAKKDMKREMADEEAVAAIAPVRVFPAPVYGGTTTPAVRSDFRETLHWVPQVKTGTDGTATVSFYLSDAVTSFRVLTEGAGGGRVGRSEAVLKSSLPFSMSVKLPTEVSAGDHLEIPLSFSNERDAALDVDVKAEFGSLVTLSGTAGGTMSLAAQARASSTVALDVTGSEGTTKVSFAASGQGLQDEFTRELVVVPRGFPIEQQASGTLSNKAAHTIDTGRAIAGSVKASVRLYPSSTATLIAGLDGMLREPNGCFEQTSSTNYPNVMILNYLEKNNVAAPALVERAQRMIDTGYKKLVGFETPEKGYEWFGGAPGHEALSAYGLLEFIDMKAVYRDVDDAMVARTTAWLKARRDGKGGYTRNPRALDSFGGASEEVTNAYITWALSEAHAGDIDVELAATDKRASTSGDAYVLALTANTLLNDPTRKPAGIAATKRLVALQDSDGAFTKAEMSITRSGGENLALETTSLAVLAMVKAGGFEAPTRRAIDWMNAHRSGYGQWGATQATVLALKATLAYLEASAKTQGPGDVVVLVNGKNAGKASWEAGHKDAIVVDLDASAFTSGSNELKLVLDGKDALPYSLAVSFRSAQPASSPDAAVSLATTIDRTSLKMGENARVDVTVTNKTSAGQPMTLARVGIPGGMSFQTWQLKKLKDDGLVAFWETRAREVILYFRDLKPNEVKHIPLDLVALVPGTYEAPASSAYLYYTDDLKTWSAPLQVSIAR